MGDNGRANPMEASMSKAKAGRMGSEITRRCVALLGPGVFPGVACRKTGPGKGGLPDPVDTAPAPGIGMKQVVPSMPGEDLVIAVLDQGRPRVPEELFR